MLLNIHIWYKVLYLHIQQGFLMKATLGLVMFTMKVNVCVRDRMS